MFIRAAADLVTLHSVCKLDIKNSDRIYLCDVLSIKVNELCKRYERSVEWKPAHKSLMFRTRPHSFRIVGSSSHKVGPVVVVLHAVAAVSEAITSATVFHIALVPHCD